HSGQASHHSTGRICRLRCAAAKQMSSIFDMGVSKMLYFLCKEKLTSRGDMEVQTSDLKQIRTASGLTQAQLAQLTAVSRQTLIPIERGDYAPSVYLALRVARALDAGVEAIVSLQEEAQ